MKYDQVVQFLADTLVVTKRQVQLSLTRTHVFRDHDVSEFDFDVVEIGNTDSILDQCRGKVPLAAFHLSIPCDNIITQVATVYNYTVCRNGKVRNHITTSSRKMTGVRLGYMYNPYHVTGGIDAEHTDHRNNVNHSFTVYGDLAARR